MSSQNEKEAAAKNSSTRKLHEELGTKPSIDQDEAILLLQQKLEEAEAKATQNWDSLLRTKAEMDNIQRRTQRDVESAHKYALEKFVLELLPVIDNMERSITIDVAPENDAVLEGVKLTLKMFYTALEKFGVEQVNPEGQQFNPELHQAVSVQADSDAKSGTVLNVLQKGYLLNNRLIRPALVMVAK